MRNVLIIFFLVSLLLVYNHTLNANETDDPKINKLTSMSLEELMNVKIITAGKTHQKISDVPASSIIITREEIEKHGYMNLEEIFQSVPGFYGIDDYSNGGMMFGIRGFWSGMPNSNIIILINGVPQTKNTISSHSIIRIQVPVESIDRIEVVRGPMSVIYGSGAFFGAINIITNDFKDGMSNNLLSVGIGSSNTKKILLKINKKSKNLKFSANAYIYDTDGIDQPAVKLMSNPEILENYGLTPDYTTGNSLEKKYKFLNLSAELDKFYFRLVLIETYTASHFTFPPIGDGNENTFSDLNLSIGYKKKFSDIFSIDGKITYYKDHSWNKYNFLHEDFFGIQQIKSNAFEFTLDIFNKISNKINLQSGFLYKSISNASNMYHLPSFINPFFENNYIDTNRDNIQSMSFYSQVNFIFNKKLQLFAGLRFEKSLPYEIDGGFAYETEFFNKKSGIVKRNKIKLIPRIAVIYKLNKTNLIKFLYGRAIKNPSFFQDYLQIQSDEATLIPEEIETREFNFQTVLSRNYSISLNLFHNILDNLITRLQILDENGIYDYSYSTNAGRMITHGVELTFILKPLNKLFIELSGTYQKTEDKLKGHENIEVAYSPGYLGYLKCRYNINNKISIALNGQYISKMQTFWDDLPDETKSFYSPAGRIGERVGNYFLLGFNIRFENLFNKSIFINVRVSNLLDSDIRYPTFTNNPYADKGTLGHGRRFLITTGWKF